VRSLREASRFYRKVLLSSWSGPVPKGRCLRQRRPASVVPEKVNGTTDRPAIAAHRRGSHIAAMTTQPDDHTAPAPAKNPADPPAAAPKQPRPREIGGPKGPEPTRYGDWEVGGRCTDF
jgi:hypothetical protein